MRHYELVVILSPMLNQDQAAETWGRIKDFVTNRNGEVIHEERWGTRRLAYPIHKGSYRFLEGTYYLTRFSAETPFNQEISSFLKLDEQVLRYLVVATEPTPPQPEPVAVTQPAATEAPAAAAGESSEPAGIAPEAEIASAEAPEAEATPDELVADAEPAAEEAAEEESEPEESRG